MKRMRKTRIIIMIVLVIAVLGMSIGFAAFSSILTISSRATVTPSLSKMVIYGLVDQNVLNDSANNGYVPDFTKWSMTGSYQINNEEAFNAAVSIIDNDTFTISNMTGDFEYPGDRVYYVYAINNEGDNDIYMTVTENTMSDFELNEGAGVCTAGDDATKSLVDEACKWVKRDLNIIDSSFNDIPSNEFWTIPVGDYIYLIFFIDYVNHVGTVFADGPFTVEFADIEFELSDVEPVIEEQT